MAIKIGLVGYGVGGRLFHMPYIQASEQCVLAGVVTRSAERAAEVAEDAPGTPVASSLAELVDAGVDAVVISTPPETRRALALEAIARGVHVVADKPFAPSAEAGRELSDAADRAGVLLNVFHNRRLDADIVTARRILDEGSLGAVQRLDLRCDQDDPATLEAGPTGGLLRDLGSHVIDQALHLMGPAAFVSAQLDVRNLPAGPTDVAFTIAILHENGSHSHVSSSKINRLESRELRLLGEHGSYVSDYRDVQIDAIRAGRRPGDDRETWGYEQPDRWGVLAVGADSTTVPSAQGDYTRFYDALAEAIEDGGRGPVPAEQGIAVLRVLDAARVSASERRTVAV